MPARSLHFDRAFSVCRYDGTAKNLIHQFKYNGKEPWDPCSGNCSPFYQEYDVPITALDVLSRSAQSIETA
jgi:hypothetical protein